MNEEATKLERVRTWIQTFPNFSTTISDFKIDYTDNIPSKGGIFPSGMVESNRKTDILGNVYVRNTLNYGLYYSFQKSPDDDTDSKVNADWVLDFQEWVQSQSINGSVPEFGENQTARAENGALFDANEDGTATYMVQLSISFDAKFIKFS